MQFQAQVRPAVAPGREAPLVLPAHEPARQEAAAGSVSHPLRGRNVSAGSDPMAPDDPDFSDVSGGSSSTADAKGGRTYTIAKGDTLGKIAKHFYGDAKQWKKIHEANKDIIKNPDLIFPGQVIKIPDA